MPTQRLLTITYDPDLGELMDIRFSKAFLRETALLQTDLLGDIGDYINREYYRRLSDWQEDLEAQTCR